MWSMNIYELNHTLLQSNNAVSYICIMRPLRQTEDRLDYIHYIAHVNNMIQCQYMYRYSKDASPDVCQCPTDNVT